METISEEQVLHNKLSYEINIELINLMKRIVELQQQNTQLRHDYYMIVQDNVYVLELEQRIDKAIKLIEPFNHTMYWLGGRQYGKSNLQKALEILKGEENE